MRKLRHAHYLKNTELSAREIAEKHFLLPAISVSIPTTMSTLKKFLQNHKDYSMSEMTPREIVSELDNYIIGQNKAKRSVAIALRNRWRRMQLNETLRHEVTPKIF